MIVLLFRKTIRFTFKGILPYIFHYNKYFFRCVSGYFSARLYKTIRGVEWKKAALYVSFNFV